MSEIWRGTYLGMTVYVKARNEYEAKQLTLQKVLNSFNNGTKKSTNRTQCT